MDTTYRKGLCLLLLPFLLFTGCNKTTPTALEDTNISDSLAVEEASSYPASGGLSTTLYKDEDFLTDYDDTATFIYADGTSARITGEGAVCQEGLLTITAAGTYVLSGAFNGQVRIDASADDLVHLILQDFSVQCEESAAIFGMQSDKLVITLAADTENTVTDAVSYVYEDPQEDEPNSAIFSKDDLTFNGTGTLIVNGNYEDGIRSKDDIRILSGTYQITSVKDAIQGKDSVAIAAGTFTITAGNDAIKASNDQESTKGYVTIDGGTYDITCEDDAFHAETAMTINDGNIQIARCYEGIEGWTVLINGGTIHLTASDDGINAAGASSQESSFRGMDAGDENASITINGGSIYVNADGDGIDSNGYFYLNGGTLYIDGPENDGNGALDYGLGASATGGTIVAAGSAGMAMQFDSSSTQGSILYNFSQWQDAGTTVTLSEGDTVLLSYAPQKKFNSLLLSAESLQEGGTYTLSCGTVTEEITLTSLLYGNGGFPGNPSAPGGRRPSDLPEGTLPDDFSPKEDGRPDRDFFPQEDSRPDGDFSPQEGNQPDRGFTPR